MASTSPCWFFSTSVTLAGLTSRSPRSPLVDSTSIPGTISLSVCLGLTSAIIPCSLLKDMLRKHAFSARLEHDHNEPGICERGNNAFSQGARKPANSSLVSTPYTVVQMHRYTEGGTPSFMMPMVGLLVKAVYGLRMWLKSFRIYRTRCFPATRTTVIDVLTAG